MATVDEIGQEKQRISERLARLDAERTKLADQLNELEIAERVLSRFGGKAPPPAERRRTGIDEPREHPGDGRCAKAAPIGALAVPLRLISRVHTERRPQAAPSSTLAPHLGTSALKRWIEAKYGLLAR